ncbi:MAG: zinc-binding alcohol dehydrogenase [Rhizobiaceae bacterium]|nr:zinc-binding alcohol dehydrogenase [Rhizobiaceae bacterium]MCV0404816.1 zinc-binding alcohol dehydrogenase [Rhizobiaceae bacterium]
MKPARAFWLTAPGRSELREAEIVPGPDDVLVETLFSGISRGTERLVAEGRVPASEHARMRCPMQEGDFPFPVKYGYAAVGIAREGPPDLVGRCVFSLHPHQDRFTAAADMVVPLPDTVPAGRAVLAANMETALNVVWDAGVGPGDRVTVIGAGVVGALAGWLAARMPGTEVTLVDIDEGRSSLAATLGCGFATPERAPRECDIVIHASATQAGLTTALEAAGVEARVVEASWHGDRDPVVPLGGSFHAKRLSIVSSQVGMVPAARRPRWTRRRRLEKALELLADERLDALISGETPFPELPARYAAILADPATLCHRIRYQN